MKKNKPFNPLTCLFMRIGLPLLLINSLTIVLHANSTTGQEILDRRINLVAEQKEIRSILTEISRLAAIKFVYSAQKIPARKKVTILAHDQRLGDVLDMLLAPLDVHYRVSGTQIVLKRKEDIYSVTSIPNPDYKLAVDIPKTVTGKVTGEKGEPLAGVSVVVRETNRGTVTNSSGEFSINVEVGETLDFSMVGYTPSSLKVGQTDNVTVQLAPIVSSIDEVVVVGYGTQRRTNVTGAISSVSGKTIAELPVPSVSQALQGRVAGVTVTNNGSPGTQPIVRIRGISSISFASDPLYVIDGFPTGDLAAIDTRDIETVDVLKDASAAAIYGSRATNGVVMISTKKGRRDGKLRVSLDSYYGTQKVTERLDLLDREGFKQYALAYRGSLPGRLLSPEVDKPIYQGASQTYGQTDTDWQDEYFRNGMMTQHNVGLSGGNEVSRFYASAGFMDQKGTAPAVGYRRYNFRINSDHIISKVFTFGQNLYAAYGDQRFDNNETGSRTNLVNVIRMMPHMPVYDPTSNGGYRGVNSVLDGGDPTNPVEDAELKNPGNRRTAKILGTAFLEIGFTSWLKFRSTFGVDYANGLTYSFQPIYNNNGTIAGSSATQATWDPLESTCRHASLSIL